MHQVMDPPIQNGFWSLPYFLCSTQEVKLKFEQTKGNILLLINSALSPPLSPQHWSQMSPNSQKYLHASLYCCVDLVKQCFNSLLRQRMDFFVYHIYHFRNMSNTEFTIPFCQSCPRSSSKSMSFEGKTNWISILNSQC